MKPLLLAILTILDRRGPSQLRLWSPETVARLRAMASRPEIHPSDEPLLGALLASLEVAPPPGDAIVESPNSLEAIAMNLAAIAPQLPSAGGSYQGLQAAARRVREIAIAWRRLTASLDPQSPA
jgi:hypothetical protein